MFAVLRVFTLSESRPIAKSQSTGMAIKWASLIAGILMLILGAISLIVSLGSLWAFFDSQYAEANALEIMNLSLQLLVAASTISVLSALLVTLALFKKPRVW
jgi:hypothetical protein